MAEKDDSDFACDRFAPQLWRASSCKHCFQPKSTHKNVPEEESQSEKAPPPLSRRATYAGKKSTVTPPVQRSAREAGDDPLDEPAPASAAVSSCSQEASDKRST